VFPASVGVSSQDWEKETIGTPIPNTNVYILSHKPTDTTPYLLTRSGACGLLAGGAGVSCDLPYKTAERWRPDPFVQYGAGQRKDEEAGGQASRSRRVGARLGNNVNMDDLEWQREDGQLDHMGHADNQVKVKRFRVKLNGVSAAMHVRLSFLLILSFSLFFCPSICFSTSFFHCIFLSSCSFLSTD